MAYEQPNNIDQPQPVTQNGVQAGMEMAEEVERRWLVIAPHHVVQRNRFLQTAMPAGWLDMERDISVTG